MRLIPAALVSCSVPSRVSRSRHADARCPPSPALTLASIAGWLDRTLGGVPVGPVEDPHAVSLSTPADQGELPPEWRHCCRATFASGCFWGPQQRFSRLPGVVSFEAGYTQGRHPAPTYKVVCGKRSGHAEAVRVTYDPALVSYEQLLCCWWDGVSSPSDGAGQGADRGPNYRLGVYWHDEDQRSAASRFLDDRATELPFGCELAVELKPCAPWHAAEANHQHFLDRGGLDSDPDVPHWMGSFVD